MKTLLIMRHAKSSWSEDGTVDHDRPLNRRGREAAPRMGRWLRAEGFHPERILCSSANRAYTTAELLIESSGWDVDLQVHGDLYLASPATYLEIVQQCGDPAATTMVIGHNPGLEQLVYLTTARAEAMPTAGVACVDFEIEHWRDLGDGTAGNLRHFWRPKEITA